MLPLLLVDWTLAELFDLSKKALAGVLERDQQRDFGELGVSERLLMHVEQSRDSEASLARGSLKTTLESTCQSN